MLKALRKQSGRNAIYVADKLNVSRTTFYRIEKGQAPLNAEQISTLSTLYGVGQNEIINSYLEDKNYGERIISNF